MTEQNALIRKALGNIAWGNLLILLDVNLGRLDVLPNWVGYLLIFYAIGYLADEARDLPLLKPFCVLLGAAELLDWLAVFLAGEPLTGQFFLVNALIVCVSLYFHFQLLTDLALLAEECDARANSLRSCRNVEAVIQVILLLPLPWEEHATLSIIYGGLLVAGLIVCAFIIYQLFVLRNHFPAEETSEP